MTASSAPLIADASNNHGAVPIAMPSLSVRRLDPETYEQLRVRAERGGLSIEEEARRILRQAQAAPDQLGDLATELFGPDHGVTLDLPAHPTQEPVRFDP